MPGWAESPLDLPRAAALSALVGWNQTEADWRHFLDFGDVRALDDGGRALVRAMREAMLNAVRHGSPPVSAYVEIGPASVEAFVRDHGIGFDPDAVPADRLGVRESILGRMSRHGGTATVRRRDPGTEVILVMPHPQSQGEQRIPDPAAPEPTPVSVPTPERATAQGENIP